MSVEISSLGCREMEGMLPWQRHDFIMQFHQQSRAPAAPTASTSVRTDMDAIREHHRFIREDGGDLGPDSSWEERMAARYYKKLVKEYAVVDLGRYKEGKVGMRWRTESEVVSGKGQFECASTTCQRTRGLRSFEVPFVYKEQGETKRVRYCPIFDIGSCFLLAEARDGSCPGPLPFFMLLLCY